MRPYWNYFIQSNKVLSRNTFPSWALVMTVTALILLIRCKGNTELAEDQHEGVWQAPDTTTIPHTPDGDRIRYGRKLISNTSHYFGPLGVITRISNNTNCENCHIAAGTKPYGNSFAAVASLYPVLRSRSGKVETIEFRINDCFERSMNGKALDSTSMEMRAMVAYLKWVGHEVPKGAVPPGTGTSHLSYLNRPADTLRGRLVYEVKCKLCHGSHGEGLIKPGGTTYLYPPLWGSESYNTAAGMYRLSRLAGFVKSNMPFGTSFDQPQLSDEESWDVAAFVNSRPRPAKTFLYDWPDLRKKAIDYPFGPYADGFSEMTHKYGPFGPIRKFYDSLHIK